MDAGSFEAVSRRASLLTMSIAGVAALASPLTAGAKKKKKKKKGDVNKLCKAEVGSCTDFLLPLCMDDPECLVTVPVCCEHFATCDAAGVLNCIRTIGT